MKKFFTFIFIIALFVIFAGNALAQMGGGISTAQFFQRVGNAIFPAIEGDTIGSETNRVAGIYADNIDATILEVDSTVSGDLNVSGDVSASGTIMGADSVFDSSTSTDLYSITARLENVYVSSTLSVGDEDSPARVGVAGNGVTFQLPDHYTATAQQMSQTIAIEGDGSAYFYAEDITGDVETIFGASINGNGIIGTISPDALELRTNNALRLFISDTGNVGIGSSAPTSTLTVAGSFTAGNATTTDLYSVTSRFDSVSSTYLDVSSSFHVSSTGGTGADRFGFDAAAIFETNSSLISSSIYVNSSVPGGKGYNWFIDEIGEAIYLTQTSSSFVGFGFIPPEGRLKYIATYGDGYSVLDERGAFVIDMTMSPSSKYTSNTYDVGSSGAAWRNVYASGTAYIGTDVIVNGQSVCLEDGTNCPSSEAYAGLYISGGSTATAIASSATWYTIQGYSTKASAGFTNTSSTFTATYGGTYQVSYSISAASAVASKDFRMGVSVDGTPEEGCYTSRQFSSVNGTSAAVCLVELTGGEALSLIIQNNTDTTDPTVVDSTLVIKKIF